VPQVEAVKTQCYSASLYDSPLKHASSRTDICGTAIAFFQLQ